jgi:erythromycin esterase
MKHRLVEYLVRRRGFRVFAMEADGAGSCAIDRYVKTGEGDPAQLIRDLKFWTWSTEEFLGLVRWMRDYNRTVAPDQRVSFRGIDMQNFLAASQRVISFLGKVDPPAAQQVESAYRCLGPLEDHKRVEDEYLRRDIVEQMKCAAGIESVYQQMSRNRARYEAEDSSAYTCTLWSAHLMKQAEMLLKFPSTRDHLYGENILSLAGESREKIIVWAHNGHIGNIFGAMGRRLKRQLGPDYLMVGFSAFGGSFRARTRQPGGGAGPPVSIDAALPAADSYEDAFHRAGLPRFVVDLRSLRDGGSGQSWMRGPHPLRDVGGAYDAKLASSPSRLPDEFDLFVFFDHGDPSTMLPKDLRKPS